MSDNISETFTDSDESFNFKDEVNNIRKKNITTETAELEYFADSSKNKKKLDIFDESSLDPNNDGTIEPLIIGEIDDDDGDGYGGDDDGLEVEEDNQTKEDTISISESVSSIEDVNKNIRPNQYNNTNRTVHKHVNEFIKNVDSNNIDTKKQKAHLLFKIHILHTQKNVNYPNGNRISRDASFEDVEETYNQMNEIHNMKSAVDNYKKMLGILSTGLEFLNNKFDPIDVELDGWSQDMHNSLDSGDYDEVFGQLHEKYNTKSQMSPEMKLIMMIVGSAMMHHLSKRVLNNPSNLFSAFGAMGGGTKKQNNKEPEPEMSGPSGFDDMLNKYS